MKNDAPILLVEDTSSLQVILAATLRDAGYPVAVAGTLTHARREIEAKNPDIILLDLMLPDGDGIDLLEEITRARPTTKVIILTANGSVDRAVGAMRAGAFDFLQKPVETQHLLNAIMNARSEIRPYQRNKANSHAPRFFGKSEPMKQVHTAVRAVATSMASVFITGESGTGKQTCAQAIHDLSNRYAAPFIAFNCAAIAPAFQEVELFGYTAGAGVAGATTAKTGAILAADQGTLFLDEICDLAPAIQARLVRVLQSSSVQPLGGSDEISLNIRVICATSRDPLAEVRAGRLRADLYYRLHVVPIFMPPLRDRESDIVDLAQTLLAELCKREARNFEGISPEAKTRLVNYAWPGNVRQLRNTLWNIVVLHEGPLVTMACLPPEVAAAVHPHGLPPTPPFGAGPGDFGHAMQGAGGAANASAANGADAPTLTPHPAPPRFAGRAGPTNGHWDGRSLAEIERNIIEDAIHYHDGSVPLAAKALDVSPSTLYRKLESWGLPARRKRG